MSKTLRWTLLAVAVALAPLQVRGQVVAASTFGPGDAYDVFNAWSVNNTNSLAVPFDYVGPTGFFLTQVRLALFASTATPYVISFSHGPSMNGAVVLESWSVVHTSPGIATLASILNPGLVSGDRYWLSAENPASFDGAWARNNQGLSATQAANTGLGSTWFNFTNTVSAYDITIDDAVAVATPEPSTILLVGSGVLGLMIPRIRRRRATV